MNIFAYGTLMEPEIMREVSGCSLKFVDCTLHGYQRYLVRDEQYPGMVRKKNSSVQGVLYLDVLPEALRRLDIFEGDFYERQEVQVDAAAAGDQVSAMAYVVKPEYVHLLTQEIWSYSKFLKKGKQLFAEHYVGFDGVNTNGE